MFTFKNNLFLKQSTSLFWREIKDAHLHSDAESLAPRVFLSIWQTDGRTAGRTDGQTRKILFRLSPSASRVMFLHLTCCCRVSSKKIIALLSHQNFPLLKRKSYLNKLYHKAQQDKQLSRTFLWDNGTFSWDTRYISNIPMNPNPFDQFSGVCN